MEDAEADKRSARSARTSAAKAQCAITGREQARRDLVALSTLRPGLADRIRGDYPRLPENALISRAEVER